MNLSGPMIGLVTSPGMVLRLRKSKNYALVDHLCSERSPKAFGQSEAGRYLFAVVIRFPDGKGYTVTARPMTDKEERRYRRWKER